MPGEAPIGRQAELARIDAFLADAQSGLRALAVTGPAGIGKTTLWQEAARRARAGGWLVLTARPTGVEAQLSFAGLADLLAPVEEDVFAEVPPPQRKALDVALLREEAVDGSVDRHVVSAGVLSLLRALAGQGPVVVAVDDAQWLDSATAGTLSFAVRRLEALPVAVLVSVRADDVLPQTFEQAVDARLRAEVPLGPLTVAALHRILKRELGVVFTRPLLVRIVSECEGNPFYALEIARELARVDVPPGLGSLPIPGQIRKLTHARLGRLPSRTQEALLAAACLSRPSTELVDVDALVPAEQDGIVNVERQGGVRFGHPLFASAIYEDAPEGSRRRVHRLLAEKVGDAEERARHLALAADGPEETVAAALDAAAEKLAARGASAAAVELAELALRLTPPEQSAQRVRRGTVLGNLLYFAGDATAAIARLERVLDEAPPSPDRARALLVLGNIYPVVGDHDRGIAPLREASECADDPLLAAEAHARTAWILQLDPPSQIEHARAVLELIEEADASDVYSFALQHLAWGRLLNGDAAEHELIERSLRGQRQAAGWAISSVGPRWPLYFDDFATARTRHGELLRRTEESGNEVERQSELVYLALIELWSGRAREARALAVESLELAEQIEQEPMACVSRYAVGLTEAQLGRLDEAESLARVSLEWIGEPPHGPAFFLAAQTYALLGHVAYERGAFEEASGWFALADDAVAIWREPAPLRYHGDQVAVVIALGELDRAEELISRLEARAQKIPRPWLSAVAARSRGLLSSARGDLDCALAAYEQSLAHVSAEAPFERARTLLALGQLLRRRKARREARAALLDALALFEQVEAPLWADRARAELGRVPVRRAPSDLTPTEETIASLAATGLTNRAIAERIYLSPKTVEGNLARAYRKLGIRSRAELGRAMAEREQLLET